MIFHWDRNALSYVKADYYYFGLSSGHSLLVVMWILAVTLLMMGGIMREKAAGSSNFTLALPISRARLMTARIGMGLLQAVTLAIVPWFAMFLTEWTFGKTRSVSQAAFHIVLLLAGGLLFFSVAFLASSVIAGEYTAPIVSFGAVIVTAIAFSGSGLRPYSPLRFMDGAEYLNHQTNLLSWPIPWLQATIYVLVASLLLVVSVKVIQRREF
jgi:ABC-2 type transport system permease protein